MSPIIKLLRIEKKSAAKMFKNTSINFGAFLLPNYQTDQHKVGYFVH